jgi:hypothetical protein
MRITNDGNVGIGITNPSAKLHINPATVDEIAIAINGTQNYSANNYQRISAGDASSLNRVAIGFGYNNTPEWTIKYSSYHTHAFFTGNDWGSSTEKLRITSAGNVGIGTTNPGEKLDILGSGAQFLRIANVGTYLMRFGIDASNNGYIGSSNATPIGFYTNSVNRLFITTAGNVGINNSSPQFKLHVLGTTGGDSTFKEGILIENSKCY